MKSYSTVLFDLDGVITNTASLHAQAWKRVFDRIIECLPVPQKKFSLPKDYLNFVDGRNRIEGINAFLNHRGITAEVLPNFSSDVDLISYIAGAKNEYFLKAISQIEIPVYPDALRCLDICLRNKYTIGLTSSSKNARYILERLSLLDYFDSILDGLVAEKNDIASKPNGDFYRYAAVINSTNPKNCMAIEDAISGIVSAKNAGIGVIVGVAREIPDSVLFDAGADVVVRNLDEIDFKKISSTFSCYR